MKTVEETAKEYENKEPDVVSGEYTSLSIINAFKAGVEFAQRWIPVDEELPQKMQTEPIVSKVVQVKSKNFKEPFCAFYDHLHNIWIPYPFGSNSQILEITHWRSFELK